MAPETTGSRYDLTPLLPWIEQGFTLLTPNLRLARRIKAEWDQRQQAAGLRAWQPLPVHSLEGWLQSLWQQRCNAEPVLRRILLDGGAALALWQQIIDEDQRRTGYHLLRTDAAARQAQQARDNLLRWEVAPNGTAAAEFALDADCSAYLRWHVAFDKALAKGGFATALDVIGLLAATPAAGHADRKALLVAFEEVPPLLSSALSAHCVVVEELPPPPPGAARHAIAYPDRKSELTAIARWVKSTFDGDPRASIGVVLDDMRGDRQRLEYLLRREFGCLDTDYGTLPVNFSTGWALAEVPVVRDALAALEAGGRQVPLESALALLRSPFLQLPDRHSPLALDFIRKLHDHGREQVDGGALRSLAADLRLGEMLLEISTWRELHEAAAPSVWAERFHAQLALWGWPGERSLDSLEYQQVEQWHGLLEQLMAYDAVCPSLDQSGALNLLRRCAQDASFQPRTADSRVQVLGPLEAAGLQFDHLWLCGLQASQWPAPARPNPFIPVALQRRLGMPHASAEREWSYARNLLSQYRSHCRMLHASYSQSVDGAPELPSALLDDFAWEDRSVTAGPPANWQRQWQARDIEECEDQLAPAVDAAELATIRGGSALVEDQSHCPFRAFARRRLRLQPLSEPSLALNAAERGNLLHRALHIIWEELENAANLAALDANAQQQLVAAAVSSAFETLKTARRVAVGHACIEQESRHLAVVLQQWLAVERQREDFVVVAREQRVDLDLGALPLHLQVDRIDRSAGAEGVTIIDYKSGNCEPRSWLGERPALPQLPLYSLASESPVEALAFAQVRARKCTYKGLGARAVAPGVNTDIARATRGKEEVDAWEDLLAAWRNNLQDLADSFIRGRAEVDPLNANSCTWCGLQALCRVEVDHSAPASADEEGAS
ncbi:hypothetical protein FV139_08060 [Parahaliea maris]|uniref:PD-(D/E)XK endonuclease-like domain-containing protein n=1 Tax=Parahaliea maris TaxID=2716870 RepID=A0A5C9A810_9GAMM|nr:PD-(D/E)XK nuclease family protein [Parahaliea maris]TXS95810.1 hypothetical protein FV139_08060 [Parahaliea maris]